MLLTEPHLDIASNYDQLHYSLEDFFSTRQDIPVTLQMLLDSQIDIIGLTLYSNPNQVKTTLFNSVMSYYDFYQRLLSRTTKLRQLKNKSDFTNKPSDSIGFFYLLEDLECLRRPTDIIFFHKLGVRIVGLTWENNNSYATGNSGDPQRGITPIGWEVLELARHHNLLVDTARLNDKSFLDLYKYEGKIINTHANVRNIVNSPHNLTDEQIQLIVDRQGIICLFPMVDAVGGHTFDDWYRHLDYIASHWGIQYLGLTADMFPLPEYSYVNQATTIGILKDFQDYLLSRMSPPEVEAICYTNFCRVLTDLWA